MRRFEGPQDPESPDMGLKSIPSRGIAPCLKRSFTESRDWCMLVTSVIHQNVAMEKSFSKP